MTSAEFPRADNNQPEVYIPDFPIAVTGDPSSVMVDGGERLDTPRVLIDEVRAVLPDFNRPSQSQ